MAIMRSDPLVPPFAVLFSIPTPQLIPQACDFSFISHAHCTMFGDFVLMSLALIFARLTLGTESGSLVVASHALSKEFGACLFQAVVRF